MNRNTRKEVMPVDIVEGVMRRSKYRCELPGCDKAAEEIHHRLRCF